MMMRSKESLFMQLYHIYAPLYSRRVANLDLFDVLLPLFNLVAVQCASTPHKPLVQSENKRHAL